MNPHRAAPAARETHDSRSDAPSQHPGSIARMRRRSVWVLAISMVLVTAALAMLSARPDAPLAPPSLDDASPARARDLLVWLSFGAMAVACAVFVWAVTVAGRGRLSASVVLGVAMVLHVLVLAAPLVLSRDAYSYALYGRMVSEHGLNPYLTAPSALTGDPLLRVASPAWVDEPSVYGPAFTLLSAGLTRLIRSPAGTVDAFRVIAAVASLATAALAMAAARRSRTGRTALAGVLVGWNPVMLFHTVGGGHNDALAGAAVAGALVLSTRWATAAAGLGAMVKATAAAPLVVVAAAGVLIRRSGERLRELLAHLAIVAAVAVPAALPFMQATDPTLGLATAAGRRGWMAPSRLVERGLVTLGVSPGAVVRVGFALVALWAIVQVIRGLRPGGPEVPAAVGWAALIALLAGPLLLPWYLPVALAAAWALPRVPRNAVVGVSVLMATTMFVAERGRAPDAWDAMLLAVRYLGAPAALALLVLVLLGLRRRIRAGASLADDQVPGGGDHGGQHGRDGAGQTDAGRIHHRPGQDQGGRPERGRQGGPGPG